MNVDKEIPASWSELALQDLLIDVAAVVDATGFDRTSNILNGPNGNLGRVPDVVHDGNNLRNATVWKDERI
jgi:hypothetical protein